MKRAAFHTLGCKVNSYETENMQKALMAAGYEICSFEEKADVYIINTCTVTNVADRKSRQMIRRARSMNEKAIVVAAGCYAQASGEKLKEEIPVDLILGNREKQQIAAVLERYLEKTGEFSRSGAQPAEGVLDSCQTGARGAALAPALGHIPAVPGREHTRAFLKIQDGCNQFCSYCIIPFVRGRVRSRGRSDIRREAEQFAAQGFRELVLTGIHLSSYGSDPGASGDLGQVIASLDDLPGIERIRVGSLEPLIITEEFVRGLQALRHFCPHFHLSLQSGSDAVLKRMNRHYSAETYRRGVDMIRRVFPEAAITTDVIVGFPGETEQEFSESEAFIRELNFYETHIFPYSRREGTRAAAMPDQRTRAEKAERASRLSELNRQRIREFLERRIGRSEEILTEEWVERGGARYLVGNTREYVKIAIPEQRFGESRIRENCLVSGRVGGFLEDGILLMEDIAAVR
ncbi:tRNA (N(6)-L-threonylcarbamoyladenosine(37)-C(2))-methylthiotransferase MtaB [Lachnospiraceae bacterium]|nr:tRNA (N(6)-L-threonylcarbamoyladenosine(37)-C(2))-methylthiotransferase MtaB [Lachnospiraceae bacterium]